jgi:3-deoxy-manno-octulosonate cytidylyltransferase (CMP-KDO synthetase)
MAAEVATREVIGVIPARLASTRLPGKVLLDRTGKPLIQHVWEAASRSARLSRLVIATDDQLVLHACRRFGAEAVMTDTHHQSGTSRVQEVAAALNLPDDAIVVNVQGDEPDMDPGAIDAGVDALIKTNAPVATIASPFFAGEDPNNPAIVKVVLRRDGTAIYFSRAAIPFHREGGTREPQHLKHVGIYIYRRWFLDKYITLDATPLERTEVLEQLRIVEHGYTIAAAIFATKSTGIDTPDQYEAFLRRHAGG